VAICGCEVGSLCEWRCSFEWFVCVALFVVLSVSVSVSVSLSLSLSLSLSVSLSVFPSLSFPLLSVLTVAKIEKVQVFSTVKV